MSTMSTKKITFLGNPISVIGCSPAIGEKAKDFELINSNLDKMSLNSFDGKKKVVSVFPSIDTPVCASSVKEFNQFAATIENCVVLCVSADLPFAQSRYCGAEGLDNVVMLSTYRNDCFMHDYGTYLNTEPLVGLSARAVFILDEDNKVIYHQLVGELTNEPDYEKIKSIISA